MTSKRGRALADVMASIDDDPLTASDAVPQSATRTADTEVRQGSPAIVPVNILVTPRDRKRLRQLSLDTGLSVQKLGHEAWNRLLESRGLEPLEPVTANVPSGRARRG